MTDKQTLLAFRLKQAEETLSDAEKMLERLEYQVYNQSGILCGLLFDAGHLPPLRYQP